MCSDTCPAVKSDMCCDIWSDFGPDVCFPGPPNSKKQRDISQHKRQCRLGQIIFSGFCGGLNFKNSLTGQAEVFVRCSLVQYAANFPSTSFCYISATLLQISAIFTHNSAIDLLVKFCKLQRVKGLPLCTLIVSCCTRCRSRSPKSTKSDIWHFLGMTQLPKAGFFTYVFLAYKGCSRLQCVPFALPSKKASVLYILYWRSILHSFWHSIWHSIWQFFLAFYLAYILGFWDIFWHSIRNIF